MYQTKHKLFNKLENILIDNNSIAEIAIGYCEHNIENFNGLSGIQKILELILLGNIEIQNIIDTLNKND